MTQQEGLYINKNCYLHNATEALNYCLFECGKRKLGCAVDCLIRKRFRIPPHGSKYPVVNERKKLVKW